MPKRTTASPEAGAQAEARIDLSKFAGNELVAYYDVKNHTWNKGQLEAVPVQEGKQIKIKTGGAEVKAGPVLKILEVPQGEVELNGKKYKAEGTAADLTVGAEGEILCNLVSADGQERMEHVDVEMIKNIQQVEKAESEADTKLADLKKEINKVSSIKKKELMAHFNGLQMRVENLVASLGRREEWGDLEEAQVKSITAEIARMEKELQDGLRDLEGEVSRITGAAMGAEAGLPEIAGDLLDRRDREMKTSPAVTEWETRHNDWQDRKDKHDKWQKSKKFWDKWSAMDQAEQARWQASHRGKTPPRDPGAEPQEAGNEPKKPAGADILHQIYEDLKSNPNLTQPQKDLLKEVKERSDKKVKNSGIGADIDNVTAGKEEQAKLIIGEVMAEVLEVYKKQKEGGKAEAFDFKKEKAELEGKINSLNTEAQALNIEAFVNKSTELKDRIVKLKEEAGAEEAMAKIWEEANELEMRIFSEKRKKAPPEKIKEKEADIPDTVLAEIFMSRPKEVARAMRAIYEDELGAAAGGGKKTTDRVLETMKNLFGGKPSKDVLEKLMQCGIRSWDQFKKLWDKKYAQEAGRILHQWAQDDLRGEVARHTSNWDRIKAIKWQLAGRIAANIALVGGGAIAVTALFASGGLAGVGLAAAGGAAGGGVRAALQKLLFGRKYFEDKKQKQLQELATRKKTEVVADLMKKRFGEHEDRFEAGTEQMFATLVSEAIREVNAELGKKEAVAGGPELAGKAKSIYLQRMKEFKWEGEEPTEEQRRQFAVAVNILMEQGRAAAQEAIRNADPLVIRMLDGIMAGYSGQAASAERYGWKGAAATTALGAAAGVAFFADQWYARGAMGALGGAAAGYHFGETRRLGKLEQKAESNITARLIKADKWRKDFEKGALSAEDTHALCDEISKFNRYLKGIADSKDEEGTVALLQDESRALLRRQAENLVYEAYRRGLFAHRAILDIQQRSDETAKEAHIKAGDKFAKWLKRNGTRAAYTFGGAVAGAGLAIAAGAGIKELREVLSIAPLKVGAVAGAEQPGAGKAAAKVGAAELAAAGAARGGAAAETAAETVQSTATIAKGQGILHAANKLMHDQPKFFEGWSKQQVHNWKTQELQDMGFKFRGGKWGYPVTVHEGAKVHLVVGADGKPHLQLGAEHVTEHKYYKWTEGESTKAKQLGAHEEAHRRAAIQMETAAEMRGEEVPLPEQKYTKAQLRAGEEIYTRVEELPKAGAAGVTAEELAARHERAHKAYDELATAKSRKTAAMPQEEVVRRPRAKAGLAKAETPALNVERVQNDLNILQRDWDNWFGDYQAEDRGDVISGLRQKMALAISDRPDLQDRFDKIVNNNSLNQRQKLDQLVAMLSPGALSAEERIFLGADYVENDKMFTQVIQEGFRYTIAKDGSHAMKVEDLTNGEFTFLSTGKDGYLYGVMPDGQVGRI